MFLKIACYNIKQKSSSSILTTWSSGVHPTYTDMGITNMWELSTCGHSYTHCQTDQFYFIKIQFYCLLFIYNLLLRTKQTLSYLSLLKSTLRYFKPFDITQTLWYLSYYKCLPCNLLYFFAGFNVRQ